MKFLAKSILLLASASTSLGYAQISSFKHVVVIFQENRTPDNLFQGLCVPPFGTANSCSTVPTGKQYNIQTRNWLNKRSRTGFTQPLTVPMASTYDLNHGHAAWQAQCDKDASGKCKMDGASIVPCVGICPTQPQFRYVVPTPAVSLNPYLELATQYGWANYMFQTNQGPSFPAHQYIFGATSARSANDDALGIFSAENTIGDGDVAAGCAADPGVLVQLINAQGIEVSGNTVRPCFEHQTVSDLLEARGVTWRYYAPSPGSIWTAPNAIHHICLESGTTCIGPDWMANVDLNPSNVLTDIGNCNLRQVSWVIPTGQNSDHAKSNTGGGPAWVASIVNAIGNSACGYWRDTAIFITWDDWGGWYDHEPPAILHAPQAGYQYGFRVPLLAVSAYTAPQLVDNKRHDFGSIVRFIEHNYGIGNLGFADTRCDPSWSNCSLDDLPNFFNLTQAPRPFQTIHATVGAEYFLNDKSLPTDPDDD